MVTYRAQSKRRVLLPVKLNYSVRLQPYEWLVGVQYKPVELTKADWPLIRRSPPWAIDAWGLGKRFLPFFTTEGESFFGEPVNGNTNCGGPRICYL